MYEYPKRVQVGNNSQIRPKWCIVWALGEFFFFLLILSLLTNVLLLFRSIYDLESNDHSRNQENGTGRGQRQKGAKWQNVVWPLYVLIPCFLYHTNYLLCVDDAPASQKTPPLRPPSVLPLSHLPLHPTGCNHERANLHRRTSQAPVSHFFIHFTYYTRDCCVLMYV